MRRFLCLVLLGVLGCPDSNNDTPPKITVPDMSAVTEDMDDDLTVDMARDQSSADMTQPRDMVDDDSGDMSIAPDMRDMTDMVSGDMAEDMSMSVDMTDDMVPDMGMGARVSDDFAGNGPLLGYTTNNMSALPDIARVSGRYRANLVDNTNNVTLHFNQDQGRLDAKVVSFPFEYIARNIGIGTQQDSQIAPSSAGNPYLFAGVQVHVLDLNQRDSSHIVVGHRGNTAFTVEGKNTVNGSSSVNDVGANTVPDGRADIRVVGNMDRTLTIYWQRPNPSPGQQADQWTLYRNSGNLPGAAPAYGAQVYIGLITYAFNLGGLPFVGTCDGVELVGE